MFANHKLKNRKKIIKLEHNFRKNRRKRKKLDSFQRCCMIGITTVEGGKALESGNSYKRKNISGRLFSKK